MAGRAGRRACTHLSKRRIVSGAGSGLFNRFNLTILVIFLSLSPPNDAAPTMKSELARPTSDQPPTQAAQSSKVLTTGRTSTVATFGTVEANKVAADSVETVAPPASSTLSRSSDNLTEFSTAQMGENKLADSTVSPPLGVPKTGDDFSAISQRSVKPVSTAGDLGQNQETTNPYESSTPSIGHESAPIGLSELTSEFVSTQSTASGVARTVADVQQPGTVQPSLSPTLTSSNSNGQTSAPTSLSQIDDAPTSTVLPMKLKTPSNDNDSPSNADSDSVTESSASVRHSTTLATPASTKAAGTTTQPKEIDAIADINQSASRGNGRIKQISSFDSTNDDHKAATATMVSMAPAKSTSVTAIKNHHAGKIIKSSDVEKLTRKHTKPDHNNKKYNFKAVTSKDKSKKKLSHEMDFDVGDSASTPSHTHSAAADVAAATEGESASPATAAVTPRQAGNESDAPRQQRISSSVIAEASAAPTTAGSLVTSIRTEGLIQSGPSTTDTVTQSERVPIRFGSPLATPALKPSTGAEIIPTAAPLPATSSSLRPSALDYDKSSEEIFDIVRETSTPRPEEITTAAAFAWPETTTKKTSVAESDEFFLPADELEQETAAANASTASPTAPVSAPSSKLTTESTTEATATASTASGDVPQQTTATSTKNSTAERDSDTIFYISNTEVKVVESSVPTPNTKQENQFFPAIYEEDVIIDFHSKNSSGWSAVGGSGGDKYEEDIILSPMKNFDPAKLNGEVESASKDGTSFGINFVGESFIDIKENAGGLSSSSNEEMSAEIASNVIIEPVEIADVASQPINVPVIGELPPQIELSDLDYKSEQALFNRSENSIASKLPTPAVDNLQKTQELTAELPKLNAEADAAILPVEVYTDGKSEQQKYPRQSLPLNSTALPPDNVTLAINATVAPTNATNATALTNIPFGDETEAGKFIFELSHYSAKESCIKEC